MIKHLLSVRNGRAANAISSMNEFPRKSKTDAGTVFGVLAMVFIGVPIVFCLACGFGTWALLGFPGGSGWSMGKTAAWQHVLDEKRRLHGELITEMNNMAASGQVGPGDLQRLLSRADEVDRQVNKVVVEAQAKYGNPPPGMLADLRSNTELMQASANLRSARVNANSGMPGMPSAPGQSMSEMLAKQRAEAEQRAAQIRAENEQRDAERRARDQQLADQARARAEEFRNRIASSSPPAFTPSPPPVVPSQPQVEAPPGFPCTNLSQIKPKDLVHVRYLDKWYPALVLRKVGTNVSIRYTTNDQVEVVLIDRIRLQAEPSDKADPAKPDSPPAVAQANDFPRVPNVAPEVQRLPPGFRPVNPPKPVRTKDDEEAENLLVIKPKKVGEEPPAATANPAPTVTPDKPAAPPVPVANYRIWTSDAGTTVEAELVGFEFDVVQLKRRDGKLIGLPINKFSAADQAYVREKYK